MPPRPAKGEVPIGVSRWVRMVVGFSVSVAVGLSPFLGNFDVPLFTPLLQLFPGSLRQSTIALSAAVMGLTAILVQWDTKSKIRDAVLRRRFKWTLAAAGVSLLALYVVYSLAITRVPILGGKQTLSFVTGFSAPSKPPCEGLGSAECIAKELTTDEKAIESYFGQQQIRLATVAFQLPYFCFLASFGVLVGLLMIVSAIPKDKPDVATHKPKRARVAGRSGQTGTEQ